jgi:hypothetical protein
MNRRHTQQILAILGLLFTSVLVQAAVGLNGNTRIVFATTAEAKTLLATPDDYLRGLSRFDLRSRLGTSGEATTDEFVVRAQSEVRVWQIDEKRRLSRISKRLARKLRHYQLPLPDEIVLIKVQGLMEGGAAYTRHNAIILPVNYLNSNTDKQLEFLLAHELFHIISRYSPSIRKQTYAVIGFKPCNEITLPHGLAQMKISNPDAPYNNFYIDVKVKENKIKVIPVIYSSEPFNPAQNRTFFDYLRLGFIQIDIINSEYKAVLRHQKPLIYPVDEIDGFFSKIGQNTKYIIHPEEILADNFAMLITRLKSVHSPEIIQNLDKLLIQSNKE